MARRRLISAVNVFSHEAKVCHRFSFPHLNANIDKFSQVAVPLTVAPAARTLLTTVASIGLTGALPPANSEGEVPRPRGSPPTELLSLNTTDLPARRPLAVVESVDLSVVL